MPKSPYAASKAGADRLAFSYFTTYGLPVVISRCANNYGAYQHPEKLIPLFVTTGWRAGLVRSAGTEKKPGDGAPGVTTGPAVIRALKTDGPEAEGSPTPRP